MGGSRFKLLIHLCVFSVKSPPATSRLMNMTKMTAEIIVAMLRPGQLYSRFPAASSNTAGPCIAQQDDSYPVDLCVNFGEITLSFGKPNVFPASGKLEPCSVHERELESPLAVG